VKTGLGRLLAVLAVVALVSTGACGKKKNASSTKSSTPSPTASASPSPAAAAKPSPTKKAQSKSGAPAPAAGGALAAGAIQPTAPGNYSYNETGQNSFTCPPTPAQTQPAPSPTGLKVDSANGNRQRSVRDRRASNGQGIVITQDYEFRPDGIYLVYLRQEQSTPVGTDTSEFEPNPPVLVLPKSPKQGQSWAFTLTSKDGRIKVEISNTIETPEENVTVANGSTSPSVRLKSTRHATGASNLGQIDITENATIWASLRDRLIPKQISDVNGTVGTCTTSGHVEQLINSTSPS
jgi:hypothetical protein